MTGNLPSNLSLPLSPPLSHTSDTHSTRIDFGTLAQTVHRGLEDYFRDLDGDQPTDLYQLVIGEVERPMLESLMAYTENNQSMAARMLGINRATLRKKLKHYGLAD